MFVNFFPYSSKLWIFGFCYSPVQYNGLIMYNQQDRNFIIIYY